MGLAVRGVYPDTFYRVAVKALIKNAKGELLLVKERSDKWDLPGGGLSHDESPQEGIQRELHEEIGVSDVAVGRPVLVRSFWLEEKQAWLMWIVYEVEIAQDSFSLGNGVLAAEYLDPQVLAKSGDERERFISQIQLQ